MQEDLRRRVGRSLFVHGAAPPPVGISMPEQREVEISLAYRADFLDRAIAAHPGYFVTRMEARQSIEAREQKLLAPTKLRVSSSKSARTRKSLKRGRQSCPWFRPRLLTPCAGISCEAHIALRKRAHNCSLKPQCRVHRLAISPELPCDLRLRCPVPDDPEWPAGRSSGVDRIANRDELNAGDVEMLEHNGTGLELFHD